MCRRTPVRLLAGPALLLGSWGWAQQGGPGQGSMGSGETWYMGPGMMGGPAYVPLNRRFISNGERIYYTGVSAKTGPIPRTGGPMWVYYTWVGCVACHGVHGQGGIPIMMGTAISSGIRYAVLTDKEHPEGERKPDHPPYSDATIKQAITQGLEPTREPLDWTMPRWQMTEQDLNDLLVYLKTHR